MMNSEQTDTRKLNIVKITNDSNDFLSSVREMSYKIANKGINGRIGRVHPQEFSDFLKSKTDEVVLIAASSKAAVRRANKLAASVMKDGSENANIMILWDNDHEPFMGFQYPNKPQARENELPIVSMRQIQKAKFNMNLNDLFDLSRYPDTKYCPILEKLGL